MSDIWTRKNELERDRRKRMQEAMEEYDRTFYYPARRQLMEDCGREGHSKGKFHDNGLGWTWWWCGKCGASWDKEGPNGERDDS